MATPAKTKVVRLRITEDELAFLHRVAAAEDRSVSAVIRMAIRDLANARDENGNRS